MRTWSWRLLMTVFAALVLAACARQGTSGAGYPAASGPINGSRWTLSELHGRDPLSGTTITLAFEDGTLGGRDGCNHYSTSYSLSGNRISIEERITGTMMACEDAIMDQADAYLNALTTATNYVMTGGELLLYGDDGEELAVFQREVRELAGKEWTVTSYHNGQQAVVSVLDGTTLSLRFQADGTLSGSAGCNNLTSSYEAANGQLRVNPVGTTRRHCSDPPGIMEQEARFVAALESAATYRIEAGWLVLHSEDGSVALTGRPPDPVR